MLKEYGYHATVLKNHIRGIYMIHVLLIENNMGDARLVEETLKKQGPDAYRLVHTVTILEATELLARKLPIDVILSDISLPDSQGKKTLSKLKKAAANLPVVFLAEKHDESLALSALEKGAQDYLLKGHLDGLALIRSIRYAVTRKKFENDAKLARNKARVLRQKATLLKEQKLHLMILSDAKDDFISMASHQLRTPATGVKQYIGMLLEGFAGKLSKNQYTLAKNAYDSNERQLHTVDDLLRVAQIDAGRLTLHKKQADITKLLRSVTDEQKTKFQSRAQRMRFDSEPKHIFANVDEQLIRMVFENLIDNASKYTPTGKMLTIKARERLLKITIEVIDSGVGIDSKDIIKLFQKFSRIHNPLSQTVSGSGLGLYWAKRVVDLHNGSIRVTSIVGKGSTFNVTLPKEE